MPARPLPTRPARGILPAPLRNANLCGLVEVIRGLLPGPTWEALRGFANVLGRGTAPRVRAVPSTVANVRPFTEDLSLLLLRDLPAASPAAASPVAASAAEVRAAEVRAIEAF